MAEFIPTELASELCVSHVVTMHNFKYTPDFLFTGESHDFWELVYIKQGSVGVIGGNLGYTLNRGEAIFHKPNEYHNIWANGAFADVVIISFICSDSAMSFFKNRLLRVTKHQAEFIDRLLELSEDAFSDPPDILYQTRLRLRRDAKFASRQLIKINLEALLIDMIRENDIIENEARKNENADKKNAELICDSIINFLSERVYSNVYLDEVCESICFSKSYLNSVFREGTGFSIMDYYVHLKLERAKILIDEGKLSFSEIAAKLSFSSVHYFSRLFKSKLGITPTEYRTRK